MHVTPTGWNAIFKPYRVEPVVGWDDYGDALIIDASSGRRVGVRDLPEHDFQNLEMADRPFVGALPGAGWTLSWADGETDEIIGFAVQDDGYALPILGRTDAYGAPLYVTEADPKATLRPPRSRP
jgi:hypothetical protein